MTDDRTRASFSSRQRRLTLPWLTACALLLGPLIAATGAAGPATAQPASATTTAAQTASAPGITLTGLPPGRQTITLVTGDQVSLTATGVPGSDRYGIIATSPSHQPVATLYSAHTTTAGTQEISAVPAAAQPYVTAGAVDRGLFDVKYLMTHETSGGLHIDVQFTAPMTDSELASAASSLPASTLIQTLDSSNAAEISVDTAHARDFWAALTGLNATATSSPDSARLADGIAAVWLDGHKLGSATTVTPGTEPLYTVSEIIAARSEALQCTGIGFGSTVCAFAAALTGVEGSGAGNIYSPTGYTCIDTNPVCHTVEISYRVPAGVYSMYTLIKSLFDDQEQWIDADNPQLSVGNDTTVPIALNDATKVTINAPDPTATFDSFMESGRVLPDGSEVISGIEGEFNNWAVPTPQATTGDYFFKTGWSLQQPMISMSVATPPSAALHPYPLTVGLVNFPAKKQTLPVLDGGYGNASDFANIDAHGKLVLIRNEPGGDRGCIVWSDKLQNALNAGAAGVLIDPTQPFDIDGQGCTLPIYPSWNWGPSFGSPVNIPFAELTYSDVQLLRERLTQGLTQVSVTGSSMDTPYEYDVTFIEHGHIPASEAHTVTSKDLAAADDRYHASQAFGDAWNQYINLASNEDFTGGISDPGFTHPVSRQVYLGPVSPELIWTRDVTLPTPDNSAVVANAQKETVYNQAGPIGVEDWNDAPAAPGVPTIPSSLIQAGGQFDTFAVCSGCRQGNDFIPWMYLTSPDPQMTGYDPICCWYWAGADPSRVHLFQDGQEIPPTSNDWGLSEYTLPPAQSRYQLSMDVTNSHTTWDFTSAEPTSDAPPAGYACAGGALFGRVGPCQATPLIFLRYDAGTDLDDAVTAPSAHQITINASELGPNAPAITTLAVWTSIDGGNTWTPAASTTNRGNGAFVATYNVPKPSATDGAVSIKVQAQDADGNDVSQTINDAVQLSPTN